jgi:hypothetical protein
MLSLCLPFVQEAVTFLVMSCAAAVVDGSTRKPLCVARTEAVRLTKPNDERVNGSRERLDLSHPNLAPRSHGSAEV